jgi:hypothetical protein
MSILYGAGILLIQECESNIEKAYICMMKDDAYSYSAEEYNEIKARNEVKIKDIQADLDKLK